MGISNEKFWSRAIRHSAGSNFTGEYLGEFDTEFKSIDEKTRWSKISWHCPSKNSYEIFFSVIISSKEAE
jgi:hypothetical protein